MTNAFDMVTPEMVQERMDSWTARDWEGIKHNFQEYKGSLGEEATKTFKEFAFGISAQNCLYAALQECK